MADYYDLLGVERDAPTDEIRTAYRARMDQLRGGSGGKSVAVSDAATLNQAWNVLSDPFQRRRYDERLRTEEEGGGRPADLGDDGSEAPKAAVPARRRGLFEPREPAEGAPARPARGQPVELPGGFVAAPTRNRVNALIVDLLVLYIFAFLLMPLAFSGLRHDALVVYKGGSQVGSPHTIKGDVNAQKAALQADEVAKVAKTTKRGQKPAKVEVKVQKVFGGSEIALIYVGSLVVALAVVVPVSAVTGQTLGKRIFQVRLIRTDGSLPGWRASALHFGLPIVLGFVLALELGPLGELAALFLVLWFTRDPLRQGVHDKLAKTYVVAVPRRSPAA